LSLQTERSPLKFADALFHCHIRWQLGHPYKALFLSNLAKEQQRIETLV